MTRTVVRSVPAAPLTRTTKRSAILRPASLVRAALESRTRTAARLPALTVLGASTRIA